MPIIEIDGVGRVEVGNEFVSMPRDQQDAFVASITQSASKGMKASGDVGPSMGESAGRGAVQGATFDFADEIAGLGAASPLPGSAAGKTTFGAMGAPDVIAGGVRMLAEKLGLGSGASQSYTAERDRVRAENDAAQKANPISYGAGQVGGSVATAVIPGTQIARGASLGRQVGQGAAIGAGMGAAQGAGGAKELSDIPGAAATGAGIGAAVGVGAPLLARGLSRVVTPLPISAERQGAVNTLAQEGIDLTAGQRTGNKALRWLESTLGDMPGAGGAAARMQERQGEQFTSAVMRRAGSNATRATQNTIDDAFTRVGGVFDDVGSKYAPKIDKAFADDIGNAVADYVGLVTQNNRAPIFTQAVEDILRVAQQEGGSIPGRMYLDLRSRLNKAARAALRGQNGDPALADALFGIQSALDAALARVASPADALRLQAARRQYANLIPIAKASTMAGEAVGEGILTPGAVRTQVAGQNRMNFARGRGELAELAKAAQAAMSPLPNSGTAPRQNMQNLLSLAGAGAGGSMAGIEGAIGGVLAPALAGRILFSRPVQSYLGNQVAAQISPTLGLLAAAPLRQQSIERARLNGLLGAR